MDFKTAEDFFRVQKRRMVRLAYLVSVLSIFSFVLWGLVTGMNILPSTLGLIIITPIGYSIYINEKLDFSGFYLFITTNFTATFISIYFGGLKSNTVYFLPLLYSCSPFILPKGKKTLFVMVFTFLAQLMALRLTQGTNLNRSIFVGDEFNNIMTFTILVVLLAFIFINTYFFNVVDSLIGQVIAERSKARSSDMERKKLISILFHDLSNNLTASFYRLNPSRVRLVQDSHNIENYKAGINNLEMMTELLEHVKELEKQKNTKEISLEDIDLSKVVKDSLITFEYKILNKNLTVKTTLDETKVKSNRKALQFNILDNLLSNAIKYSETGSEIIISSQTTDDGFSLSVINPSPPIPDYVMESLFDIDNQATSLGTNAERGSGFGLAIAHDTAKKLKGDLKISFAHGLVCFTFLSDLKCGKPGDIPR